MEREVVERFERIESVLGEVVGALNQPARNQLAADACMTRMEEDLQLLIRAITTDHQNGRSNT